MSIFETNRDPWRWTVDLLSRVYAYPAMVAERVLQSRGIASSAVHQATIRLLERQTDVTATIAWSEATRCSYGDQTWQAARARGPGVCAMSGRAIRRGDEVFQPRHCQPPALNASEMILASVLRTAEIGDFEPVIA
ncbi:DUF3331 domain-containing protein [Paraburkholderia sp. LEh10]|uniref:DUF3331 domain-containing protein n=1 Tax=Paraburkholderia sp. LEh10 TaxID=2821353 RepID=UPI001AEAE76B|nr:DUF3331 domain-containing protein [Paraburkholderia sp. LEh10]MBP0593007.1 DUF3331 domain-containing protein [Paraburkholderia sp. LEh10]